VVFLLGNQNPRPVSIDWVPLTARVQLLFFLRCQRYSLLPFLLPGMQRTGGPPNLLGVQCFFFSQFKEYEHSPFFLSRTISPFSGPEADDDFYVLFPCFLSAYLRQRPPPFRSNSCVAAILLPPQEVTQHEPVLSPFAAPLSKLKTILVLPLFSRVRVDDDSGVA